MEAIPGVPAIEQRIDVGGAPLVLVRPASADLVLVRAVEEGADEAPYWADLWPSARALAEEAAARAHPGQRVLELGCGLALPALAAARAGADVLATDLDPAALRLVDASARLNGLRLATAVLDLADSDAVRAAGPADLVLAADVLYAGRLAPLVAAAVPALLAPGGTAVVAYPFARQAETLVVALAEAGLGVAHAERTAPGRAGTTTIRLVIATAPG